MPTPSLLPIIAHARSGALAHAWRLFREAGLEGMMDDPAVLSLHGRLLKDEALAAEGAARRRLYEAAAGSYRAAAEAGGGTYPLINAAHLLGMALLVGAMVPLDLRLLGAWPRTALQSLWPVLVACAVAGLLLAIFTGALLFIARAGDYLASPLFAAKMTVVALGVANASSESALAAGLVMGVMIIPFVSSMADDSIAAVPQAMRDGSLAMGATTNETIRRVLVPAALPGIVAGIMLAVSRAIGETMIVVMAAGAAANLSANPLESMTTVTFQIVAMLTGEGSFDHPATLSAFALGFVLFLVTLALNFVALRVVKRFRESYE